MRRLLFTIICLTSLLLNAGSIWEEGSQWDVNYIYYPAGAEGNDTVTVTYRLLHADDIYMALEKTVTFKGEVESVQVQGLIRNEDDKMIYVRPALEDGSFGEECLLYDFSEPYEYGDTVRYGVMGGEVKEEFIDWQVDTLDYYMMNNGDTHCLPAWKGIIYKYGYIGGPMDLFLLEAAPGKTNKPKPSNISHVIFSTKGGHKTIYMNSGEEDDEDDIIIPYDEMLTDGTTWECLAVNTEQPDLKRTYTIQVKGDTIIGKRHCKQVYSSEHNIQKTMFEEGRKVYVANEDGQPVVLLDFNLQDGDRIDDVTTVSVWDQENLGYHYRTINIDMGFDCESYFAGDTAPWAYDLIEGIGVSKDQYLKQCFLNEENTISYMLRCWKEGTLVYQVPQEYEYVPFVREGVKWVYAYNNPFWEDVLDMPEGLQYYSFEMKGDVQIGDKTYKPVVLTHYLDKEGQSKEVEDYTPICLREEDKVVYAIHPDGIQHPQCPVGYGWHISAPYGDLPIYTTSEEFILYDFNDPMALYTDNENLWNEVKCDGTWTMTIGGQQRKCHHYQSQYSGDDGLIIEGIGYDGMAGFPLFYFETFITGFQVGYGLSHVIENGQIVYTGRWYDPGISVGISEVGAEKVSRPLDDNYYNLMGQPMGEDVPTIPGIYIHQGKKIVVR